VNINSDSVVVVSGGTNEVIDRISLVSPWMCAYDPSDGDIYVTNIDSDTVSVISGTNDSVVATVPVGIGPDAIAYDPENNIVYVANMGAGERFNGAVSLIASGTNSVVGTIRVGQWPDGATYDPYNGYIYVTNAWSENVSIISGSTDKVVGSVAVGAWPAGSAYDSQDNDIYVADASSCEVTVISGESNTVIASVSVGPAGASPYYPMYDPANYAVYVVDQGSGALSILGPVESLYAVTFVESGLYFGYVWSVTLDGTTTLSLSSSVILNETNATYQYTVNPPAGYAVSPSSGSVTVDGSDVAVSVAFSSTSAPFVTTQDLVVIVTILAAAVVLGVAVWILARRHRGGDGDVDEEESKEDDDGTKGPSHRRTRIPISRVYSQATHPPSTRHGPSPEEGALLPPARDSAADSSAARGQAVPADPDVGAESRDAGPRICPGCGGENPPAHKFCRKCGKPLPRPDRRRSTSQGQLDLVVRFRGAGCKISGKNILTGIDLDIPRGEIMGFLGRNGAGKTTLLSLVSGLRSPTSGEVTVMGRRMPSRDIKWRRRMGLVLQENALYEELTVNENLKFSASLYDIPHTSRRVREILALLGLSDRANQVVSTLSGGLKRRTAIARAFLHDPELFIIDEPTLGVDADARSAVWAYLRLLKSKKRTVIVATNYLDEALALCDRVAVLDKGRLLAVENPHELVKRAGKCLDIECDEETAKRIASRTDTAPQVLRTEQTLSGISLFLASGTNADEFLHEFVGHEGVEGIRLRAPDLSEVFKSLGE
jgi:ABC-2 type transport system ATP-binding protein